MSRPPPASGDQARAEPVPSPLNPTAAHAQDICAERASVVRDFMFTPTSASIHRSRPRRNHARGRVDFAAINAEARPLLPAILQRVLPGGRLVGCEYVALNPRRVDRHLGSFRANLKTGRWADFATGDKGGDIISLVAYVKNISQYEAAKGLSEMLGFGARR
jgi:hypothetical protein